MSGPAWCICHEAFTGRGLIDPACRHDELEDMDRLLAAIRTHERHRRGQGHPLHAYDLDLWRIADNLEGGTPKETS